MRKVDDHSDHQIKAKKEKKKERKKNKRIAENKITSRNT